MSRITPEAVVGEPEVLEDVTEYPAWLALKQAADEIRAFQVQDGSVPEKKHHARAAKLVETIVDSIAALAPLFPHDAAYLAARRARLRALGRRGLRRARLPRLARGVPAAASTASTASVTSWCSRCTRRTAAATGYVEALLVEVDLARVHRRARGGRLLEQAVRVAPPHRLHARATTRTRPCCSPRRSRCARSRPSRGARSSRTARRRATAASCARHPRSPSSTCPTTRSGCSTTRSSPSRPS